LHYLGPTGIEHRFGPVAHGAFPPRLLARILSFSDILLALRLKFCACAEWNEAVGTGQGARLPSSLTVIRRAN
jgi:hypothetical protein